MIAAEHQAIRPEMTRSAGAVRILVAQTAEAATRIAAQMVVAAINRSPRIALGLAAGRTMQPVYAALASAWRHGKVAFSQARFFALDEILDLPEGDRRTFASVLGSELLEPIGVAAGSVMLLNGHVADPAEEAARHERSIKHAGGIGLQLLGIGANGHLAFNEPGSSLQSRTRVVTLADDTATSLKSWLGLDHAPRRAISLGLANILEAESLLLVATGHSKSTALCEALTGPIGPHCPASAIRLHGAATIIADLAAAAELLRRREDVQKQGITIEQVS
ncbi:MAG: glucosamine-6-phosphate deaminase [Hyphomicrobiaceae bacterium]